MAEQLSTGNSGEDSATLSQLFDNAFRMFNDIGKTSEPTNSANVQEQVKKTMKMLEEATKLVSLVGMFSPNENIEEVSTDFLKYFLLPALLGTLVTKLCNVEDRLHTVDIAEIYFVDFLKRLKDYGIINIELPEIKKVDENSSEDNSREKSNAELIVEMVSKRNTTIQRYKEQKELEKQLETLQQNMDNPNICDEDKREYFITLLKVYANLALDELKSLAAEKPILRHMKLMRASEGDNPKAHKQKHQSVPLKPIIITRDQVQKQVYGAGYPSLPVLTVEEFYEKKIRDGEWPDSAQRNKINNTSLMDMANNAELSSKQEEMEDEEKERKIETDDPEELARARAMDEYKDTHRRGWGNRANRS